MQEGQGPKVGPDLYGVVGPAGRIRSRLQLLGGAEGKMGGNWTFDALNKWLTNPRADAPGTAMTFAGLPNEKQRADIIAYLNTLSDTSAAAAAKAAHRTGPAPARRRRSKYGGSLVGKVHSGRRNRTRM